MNPNKHNPVLLIAGVVISLFFLVLALRGTNPEQIGHALSGANLFFAPLLIICLFVSFWIRVNRWRLLLQPAHVVSATTLFPALMIGRISNFILPFNMGEFVRATVASRNTNIPLTSLLSTIFLERIFDLFVVLALAFYSLWASANLSPEFSDAIISLAIVFVFFVAILFAYIKWTATFHRVIETVTSFLPSGIQRRLILQAEFGAAGLQALTNPDLLTRVAALSILQWFFVWLCVYFSLRGVGIDDAASAALITLTLMIFVTTIVPSAPGFIGNIQIAYSLALTPFDVSASTAFAASIYYHLLMYLSVLIGGLIALRKSGYTIESLRTGANQSDAD